MFTWYINFFNIIKWPALPLVIFFVLRTALSSINITTKPFLLLFLFLLPFQTTPICYFAVVQVESLGNMSLLKKRIKKAKIKMLTGLRCHLKVHGKKLSFPNLFRWLEKFSFLWLQDEIPCPSQLLAPDCSQILETTLQALCLAPSINKPVTVHTVLML